MEKAYHHFKNPALTLCIEFHNETVLALNICQEVPVNLPVPSFASYVFQQLDEYFSQKRTTFEIPYQTHGTTFQKHVWQALTEIPYGETCSYKDVAHAINKPKAYRAVGMANNKNPIPIIIPCHRVIGIKGNLVGFAYGLAIKQELLSIEKRQH